MLLRLWGQHSNSILRLLRHTDRNAHTRLCTPTALHADRAVLVGTNSMALLDLSPELLTLCFEHLYERGRPLHSLRCLNLVCRSFHQIACGYLFRNINVTLSSRDNAADQDSVAFLEYLLSSDHLKAHVQHVTVSCDAEGGYSGKEHGSAQRVLERLLPFLPNLRHIRYVCIPPTLHENLSTTWTDSHQEGGAGKHPRGSLSTLLC